jgi:DNA-binding NtrC family response regulator
MNSSILYVDDDEPNLRLFRRHFDDCFAILTAGSGPEALSALEAGGRVGVLVADQRMAPMTGIELFSQVEQRWPLLGRVLLTAYSDRDLLLAAIQRGRVHDYVLKPWQPEELKLRLEHAMSAFASRHALSRAAVERDALRSQVAADESAALVGLERGLKQVDGVISRVAPTDTTVLIRGETGTGKELVAREIHRRSQRVDGPFIRTNCAALSEGVLESELFGHEAGAFTGASKARQGRFEQADGGTLFLDEIGDLSPNVQVKLLRVLQEREVERVGGSRPIAVDIRIVAATHQPLEERIAQGRFRQDLFFRLNVLPIHLPPLRERPEDIEPLARAFLARFAGELGKVLEPAPAMLEALEAYDWPGNVRELRNVLERAAVLAPEQGQLLPDDVVFDLPSAAPKPVAASGSVFQEIREEEAHRIREALRSSNGSRARAARLLGMPRTTLNDRIRKLEIT